jgi:drug/metabolite transporter (DMT)-like permease
MIRSVFTELLLFLLPFALYAVYLRLSRYDEENPPHPHPWAGLFVAGLAMVAASFVFWGLAEGGGEKGTYIPPRVEDGRVVPGRVEPAK